MKIFPRQNIFSVQTIFFSGGIFVMSANNLFGCFAFAKKKNQEGYLVSVKNAVFQKFYQEMFFKYFCLETNLLTGCFYLAGKRGKTERWLQMHPLLQRNQYGDQSRRRKRDEIIRTAGRCQDSFN